MLDRTAAPPSDNIAKPNFPEAQIVSGAQGIDLVVLEQQAQPVIMLDIVIPVGRFSETVSGISYLAGKMLLEGTSKKSSAEIASEIDFHGSHLEITPTLDHLYIRLYCLKKFFSNQAKLVFELLADSIFPEKEFEKLKTIRSQQIKQQHAKTNAFAGLKFRETIFGSGHPYGKLVTLQDVNGTSLDQVKAFFSEQFKVRPTIFMAGAVGPEELSIVNDRLSKFEFIAPKKPTTPKLPGNETLNISWDNSVQSSIRFGSASINKSHADIHKLKITNELLGGFFGSRLMKNIREEKGLTYGISSSMVHLQHGSYWVIGTDVLKEKVNLALNEIRKEIENLQNTPPTFEELELLKNHLKGKWLMSFDSCFNSMQMITGNYLSGLTNQFWLDFMQTVDEISAEDISATLTKHFDPSGASSVVVG
ncbi:MAG: pitrilysin family protein [Cyclobacteriaceae bacterium]